MKWIRVEDLQGREVLDDVVVGDALYVQVADDKDSEEKQPAGESAERRDGYGLHS
jgi:hypothetical protein